MIYIGIDPGVSGGVALITDNSEKFNKLLGLNKCPGTVSDMPELLNFNKTIKMTAVIEKVHSMPQQGVASTFKFGMNYGQWLGILAALQIPYIEVTPQKWMKHFGGLPVCPSKAPKKADYNTEFCGCDLAGYNLAVKAHKAAQAKNKTARKNHLKSLAQARFPKTKITLATADAVLLAVYAKETIK